MESNQEFDVAIIGQGYVGFPLALEAVSAGWKVLGVDVAEGRVASIQAGINPLINAHDPDLIRALKFRKYTIAREFNLVGCAKIVILCVPTPLDDDRIPDLSSLDSACIAIAKYLRDGTLIVNESTSYPGTLRNRIIPLISNRSGIAEGNLYFAAAPERVNPGDKVWNQKNTPRVIAGINQESSNIARKFYETICEKVYIVKTPEIAEAAKLLENTFRLVNLALVNEFDRICTASGIDTREVILAAQTKPYGFMPFFPGLGVGGHCIPVDPMYLTWWAEQLGSKPELILESSRINLSKPTVVANDVAKFLTEKSLEKKVLIFGVSYKQGIADTRESPSSMLKEELERLSIQTAWADELVVDWNGESPTTNLEDYGVCIVAVPPSSEFLPTLIEQDWFILDCTGTIPKFDKVFKV